MKPRIDALPPPIPKAVPAAPAHTPEPPPHPGTRGSPLYERIWSVQGGWDLFNRVVGVLDYFLPTFTAGITVTVRGGAQADIRRVWYLALSAAFGRFRNRVTDGVADIQFQGTWDITGKTCRVEIVYNTNKYNQAVAGRPVGAWDYLGPGSNLTFPGGGLPPAGARGLLNPGSHVSTFLQRGPEQLTIGGTLPAWMLNGGGPGPLLPAFKPWRGDICTRGDVRKVVAPGGVFRPFGRLLREFPTGVDPRGAGGASTATGLWGSFPHSIVGALDNAGRLTAFSFARSDVNRFGNITLPDDGRVITTAEKNVPLCQPPAPPLDGVKCSLLALVSATLQSPCYLPVKPPCTAVTSPTGGGASLYTPGSQPKQELVDLSRIVQNAAGLGAPTPDTLGNTADGYPAAPEDVPGFGR